MKNKVVLADADPVVRLGLEELFGSASDMQVVGICANSEEVLSVTPVARPDLVILDFDLPDLPSKGSDICRLLKRSPEAPRVLIRTARGSAECLASSVLAGADSCLHKGVDCEVLLDAGRRCAAGENVWSTSTGGEELLGHHDDVLTRHHVAGRVRLSPTEAKVLELKLRRRTNAEIAGALSMSLNTVKHHVTRIQRKLAQPIKDLL
jgi:DNA-binding NarL/FixJ family response regulator